MVRAQRSQPRRVQPSRRNGNGMRTRADRVLAQGVGRVPRNAFGSAKAGGSLCCWDATHNEHLPLPRPVGPYTVVRTTALISSSAKYIQFGTFGYDINRAGSTAGFRWTNVCALEDVTSGDPVNGTSNTRCHTVPFPGGSLVSGSGLTAVPSALTVQLMNPEAIQTTKGIIAGAVSGTQLNMCGRIETFDELATEFVSFQRPRLMSAAKLSLRGVTANSIPLNMNKVSEFAPVDTVTDGTLSWTGNPGLDRDNLTPSGWAPIVFVNYGEPEGETVVRPALRFLVTMEWRVRFDIGNPAVASHRNHGLASDADWAGRIKSALAYGHQIRDIVETVANIGGAARSMMALAA